MGVEGFQRAQFAVNLSDVFRRCNADVNRSGGGRGDHVDSRSTADLADIESDAAFGIHELRDFKNLVSQLDYGALAFFEIQSRVRGDSSDLKLVFANTLADCLDRAMQSIGRLKH